MQEVLTQVIAHLRGIWLRRWLVLIIAWVVSIAGWIYVYTIPDRYEANARIYVDTQSILKPLMSGITVQPNIDQTVAMVTKTLISRPNLEKVARMTDLDVRAKTPKETEALLDGLAGNIKLSGSTRGEDLYTIAYQNRDPQIAKKVVQSLLTILVESSLGSKRKDSDSARRFIEDQIKAYEQKLITSETALKEFKQKHLGLMPGQGGDYFSKLSAAQAAVSEAQLALREAESRRNQLKRQLEDNESDASTQDTVQTAPVNPELDARIQDLQKRLDQMRLAYTENHPDIISTKRVIAQLEEQKKQEAKTKKTTNPASSGANAYQQQMNLALAEADANVASLKARVGEFSARHNQLKQAAHMVPQVEAELTALNRDYEVNKKNYDELLSRRESAQISEEMDAKTEVIDFRVVDPPRVPLSPAFPNRPLFMTLALALGLLVGAAVAFLLSQLRPTISDRTSLREIVDQPILGSVSRIWSDQEMRNHKRRLQRFLAALASLFAAYGMAMGLTLFLTRG